MFYSLLKVLDMCAAPNLKTTQLLEMLHAAEGIIPGIPTLNFHQVALLYPLPLQMGLLWQMT